MDTIHLNTHYRRATKQTGHVFGNQDIAQSYFGITISKARDFSVNYFLRKSKIYRSARQNDTEMIAPHYIK